MSEWVAVTKRAILSKEKALLVWLGEDWPIALVEVNADIYAVDARCTHEEGWLHEGVTEGCEVICPLHEARFNLKTGQATRLPAAAPLVVYPVREDEAGVIWVQKVVAWWRE